MENKQSIYETIGGKQTIRKIVDSFYSRVKTHPELRHIFPEDMSNIIKNQNLFLTQFFDGPKAYAEDKGHPPTLRKTHLQFPISRKTSDAWLECMAATLDEVGIQGEVRDMMWEKFTRVAYHMVNKEDD